MEKTSTKYPKNIKNITENVFVLKPGINNPKLGFSVTTKKHNGKRIYSLTLVERETCPSSCFHWNTCYGNNMPFAHRFKTEGLTEKLEQEIQYLTSLHKKGILIRLHVLGDFYSTKYVSFWSRMLKTYDKLAVFGYTGREEDSKIGKAVSKMNSAYSHSCDIRFSSNKEYTGSGNSYAAQGSFEGKSFYCPEQSNKVESCADCGLCWMTKKTVKFITH